MSRRQRPDLPFVHASGFLRPPTRETPHTWPASPFSRSRLRAGAELGRHRAGLPEARAQAGVPVRSRVRAVFEGYGFPAHGVPCRRRWRPRGMAKYWVDFINGHIPNFRKSPLRADRQLCEGLLGGDRLDRGLGREGPAGRAGRGQARPDLRRQRDPVPGDQALRRALGADHLLLGERDPGSRYPAAPVGLRRARQGLLRGYRRRASTRWSAPIHAQLQRVPRPSRRGALSARPVLRGLALAEPAALSRSR